MRAVTLVGLAVFVVAGCESTMGTTDRLGGGPGGSSGGSRVDSGTGGGSGGEGRDGVDHDGGGDGEVDEMCGCIVGATQACWPGAPAERGLGICADGVQTCGDHGEFAEWGPCTGATLPPAGGTCCEEAEFGLACLDGKDNDCDA